MSSEILININNVKKISKLISTQYYHISISTDVVGVSVCAAIKNIFAMIIGAANGLCKLGVSKNKAENNYLNTAAGLLQQSINEMLIFTKKLKGKKETVMELAGVGDLYVSADGGRNSKMGYYLGLGMTFNKVKKSKMKNVTVEGAELAFELGKKIKKDFKIKKLPLMISIIDTICENRPLKVYWNYFK